MQKNSKSDISNAIEANDLERIRTLLNENPDLMNYNDCALGTWLHRAASSADIEIIKFLIECGININAEAENGSKDTPLGFAISSGRVEIVTELLKLGADPNHRDDYSRQVFRAIIARNGNGLEILRILVSHGADIHREFLNESTGQPMNALSLATDWGKTDIKEFLIDHGCQMPKIKNVQVSLRQEGGDREVLDFFENEIGPISKKCLIEIVATDPPVSIHVIEASENRPFVTLLTCGMSKQAMKVPKGGDFHFQYAELFIQLPKDWSYEDFENPATGWPIHWLFWLAKLPHRSRTWLGGPVAIVAKEDPPLPIAPDLQFTSMLAIAEKHFLRKKKWILQGRKVVQLYRLFPLFSEERNLEIEQGLPALMKAFDQANISFVFDPRRRNVGI